tara:strand:- start:2161 stop:6618 length:4458 start_codon:yes stop_codon:yes gene_type:complete
MQLSENLLKELQKRLKVGNRRGVHLNGIPGRSRYKFDLNQLSHIDKNLPQDFINSLLKEMPLKFKISWKGNVPDLNTLFDEDQKDLVKITRSFDNLINQTTSIESEKGINTFGFGFPILIRRDQIDNKITASPLLIWSLKIKRTKEFNTWIITRTEEDPIYINEVLINHLKNDAQIEISPINSEFLDDGLIDQSELLNICVDIINQINTNVDENTYAIFEEKIRNLTNIKTKQFYENLPINSNNAMLEFGGLFSIFEIQKQNIIKDYDGLISFNNEKLNLNEMPEDHFFQPLSSVETDPTQQSVLNSLIKDRNILIQGPPGTGKSQSLTALLVNALENKKKTIVVCEKKTALEVLQNSLNELGLNSHNVIIKDIIKDRRKAVDSVRDRVSKYSKYQFNYYDESFKDSNWGKSSSKIKSLLIKINKKHQKLSEKIINNKSWTQLVGNFLKIKNRINDDYDLDLKPSLFKFSDNELDEILIKLNDANSLYNSYLKNKENLFLNEKKLLGENSFQIEKLIREDFSYYKKELENILDLINEYKNQFIDIGNKLYEKESNSFNQLYDKINILFKKNEEDFLEESKLKNPFYIISSWFNKKKRNIINDKKSINKIYREMFYLMRRSDALIVASNLNLLTFHTINMDKVSVVDKLSSLNKIKQNIEEEKKSYQNIILNLFEKQDLLKPNKNKVNDSFESNFITDKLNLIVSKLEKLNQKISQDSWTNELFEDINPAYSHRDFILKCENIFSLENKFFSHELDLFSIQFEWLNFYENLNDLEKKIIFSVKDKSSWEDVFSVFYIDKLLDNYADNNLPVNENDYNNFYNVYRNDKEAQINYINNYWNCRQKKNTLEFKDKNQNLSVENLYSKKSGTKHKRRSLRQIVDFDIDLFTSFFPVILTTPDVCSNLFNGINRYFDYVIFDEASQLRLEDTLPALLKAKQIIIAGDEHQMPPSNYFSKVFDGSYEDSDEVIEDEAKQIFEDSLMNCESLLEFGEELNFQKKYLDFHYRSKHPFLIDFSNSAFYNNRLKPLPKIFDYIPIKYVQVNGTYSDRSNEAEAEAVLSIIENNIHKLPNGKYPSVGIATFNINQRNLIISKINERVLFEKFSNFNKKVAELENNDEPLFIKNLENIQGDERDVIIISTTYGMDSKGNFYQRFGSINHQKGYKLLNVLITRAKYKIYVCSSVPEKEFLNYENYLEHEGGNNRRAAFFAYLAYAKSVSDNDMEQRETILNNLTKNVSKSFEINVLNNDLESPFEEEVYNVLINNFEKSKIFPQYKFAGFRIDIVYDPKIKGVPKIAIECDGAKYHSSKEAYLHDVHRQKILESHGFVFHRIWSTNWWRNTSREINNLVSFINKIEYQQDQKVIDFNKDKNYSSSFSDDIKITRNKLNFNQQEIDNANKIINVIEKENKPSKVNLKKQVKLGSIVYLNYLNIGKKVKIKLVNKSKLNQKENIQNINVESPLGYSLLNKFEGETVKIGKLDTYVEILEIM